MINSIYTHREIFLRELISNASDAIDKIYYKALVDDSISFNKDNYFIKISLDKASRTIKISDTGIGITKAELDDHLGGIAKSGSLKFKKENEIKDGYDIIGQFGVGFYSSFLIADKVTVISKAFESNEAYKWESSGVDGYAIEPCSKESVGTDIILHVKENNEDENFDEYLEEYKIKALIKKYSHFIRYPIKMDLTERKLKEGSENEYEDVIEDLIIDKQNFEIKGIIMSSGIFDKMLKGKEVITLKHCTLCDEYILYNGNSRVKLKTLPHNLGGNSDVQKV